MDCSRQHSHYRRHTHLCPACRLGHHRQSTECFDGSIQRSSELYHTRYSNGYLRSHGDVWRDSLYECTHLFLNITKSILQLLLLTRICLGQFGIHVAYILCDNLSKHGCTLTLGTILEHLLLGFVKGNTDTLQHFHLSLHCLTHHITNTYGILISGIQSVLLRHKVIHGRNKYVETSFILQEGSHLLRTTQLHLVAYYT